MKDEILSNEQMARADAFAVAAGTPSLTLMENAGRAIAEAIAGRYAPCATLVMAGPGNNGGDGFVAARYLAEKGFAVTVAELAAPKGDAAEMAKRWNGKRAALSPQVLDGAALIVDALFGTGLSRPLDGPARDAVEAANKCGAPIVAVDIPSGVAGNSGKALADIAIKADLTVTFFRKKIAHLLLPGRALCGEIVLADIGIPESALRDGGLFENNPSRWRYPWPELEAHKYDRGHAVVVSGPAHATGAARLAARGALRAGAGLVSVASPPAAVSVNAAELTAIMVKPFEGAKGLAALLTDRRFNAVAIGPGLGTGEPTCDLTLAVLASGASPVLDADIFTAFRDKPQALFDAIQGPAVMTPHEGEFERIFPGLLERSQNRIDAARTAAGMARAVVLLKGADTVIAAPDGIAAINANAPSTLATAGAGDVLTGIVLGLLAQGMDAFAAACCGAWLHGEAAGRFGPGLISEDIPEMLPEVLAELKARR
jgi:NAD(P)H-hydrate epimerase